MCIVLLKQNKFTFLHYSRKVVQNKKKLTITFFTVDVYQAIDKIRKWFNTPIIYDTYNNLKIILNYNNV